MEWMYWLTQEEAPSFHTALTAQEQTMLESRHHGAALRQSICAQRLMKEAIYRKTGQELPILRTEEGAPVTTVPGLYVSASHTEQCCVGAASCRPVGIDVEACAPVRPRVVSRCFTARERDFLSRQENQDAWFTRLWTLKEAYGKMTGRGLLGLGDVEFWTENGTPQCSDPAVTLHLYTVKNFFISAVENKASV